MKNITGVETITTKGSTGALTLNNVATSTVGFGFEGSSTNDIAANHVAGALAGTNDILNVNLNGAKDVKLTVAAGFESAKITTAGTNDVTTLTAPGVTTYTVEGTGSVNFKNTLANVTTLSATNNSGAITTGTVDATTGFVDKAITAGTNGASVLLGAGNDNIGFTATTAKTSTVKLGAGDDKLLLKAGGAAGATYVFAEAGNDTIKIEGTSALTVSDLIDGGEGTDTLVINNNVANTMVLRGIEKLTLTKNANGVNVINSADSAVAVTAKVDANAVDIDGLTAGSTFTTVKDVATATAGTSVSVKFASAEAASTLTLGAGASGAITTDKITNVTIDAAEALSTKASAFTFTTATDVTINGTKDVKGTVAIADSKLENLTITSSEEIDMGDTANVAALKTVTATATKAATLGTINSKILTDVSVSSTTGAAEVGNISAGAASTTAVNVTVAGATTAKVGTINATAAGKLGDVNVTATKGLLTAAAIKATEAGTINLTSTADGIALTTTGIVAADTTGITVNMTAAKFISLAGTDTAAAAVVTNTDGDVTASIAGAAQAKVTYTAGTAATPAKAGVVNLTATNTDSSTFIVNNNSTADAGTTSTISLGNAKTGAANILTTAGVVDNLVVNGGTGQDTYTIGTGAHKTVTIDLGGSLGTTLDKVDFTGVTATGANSATHTGLIINLGGQATVDGDTIAANSAVQYNDAAAADAKVDTTGTAYSILNVESVVGTANNDYIIANSAGSTIAGGTGADKIILNAGKDTVVFAATAALNGNDTITGFDAGASSDVINVNAFLSAAVDANNGSSTLGVSITSGDIDIATSPANVALVYNTAGTIVDADIVGTATATNGEIVMDNNQKAVIFVATASTATTANMYYVTAGSTAGTNDTVTLVGTVSLTTGDTMANFVVDNLA